MEPGLNSFRQVFSELQRPQLHRVSPTEPVDEYLLERVQAAATGDGHNVHIAGFHHFAGLHHLMYYLAIDPSMNVPKGSS